MQQWCKPAVSHNLPVETTNHTCDSLFSAQKSQDCLSSFMNDEMEIYAIDMVGNSIFLK